MTINATDIKLLESERMSDATDGGGRRRSVVIPDGILGNVFPKVSRLDATYGRVNLRKVYGVVQTANLDVYAGAHAAITDAPDNDRIHVNLFSTASEFDTRTSARDRIESYVTAGPESRTTLYGRQLLGQQTILTYQRSEESLPEVGEVLCLSKEVANTVVYQQYVRITDVAHAVQTFTDDQGEFVRRTVTLALGAPLRYEFSGPASPSRFSSVGKESLVRNTNVADASRYYGIKKLTAAVVQNGLTVDVESVYSPIVPSTQRETAISLSELQGANVLLAATPDLLPYRFLREAIGQYLFGVLVQFDCGRPVARGSLEIAIGEYAYGFGLPIYSPISGQSNWSTTTDDGEGNLIAGTPLPGYNYYIASGVIDYESGRGTAVVYYANGSSSGALRARFRPAASVVQPSHTRAIEITLGTRGTVYSETLNPLPAPGTAVVEYRALGKWYRLRDIGAGELRGTDIQYGVGSVNYATGALVVTIGALPDIDSSIIISWGSPAHTTARAGATSDAGTTVLQSFALTDLPVSVSSLTVTYTSAGVDYVATTNGSGVITGNGLVGIVESETGIVKLAYTVRLPDRATTVRCAYSQIEPTVPTNPTVTSDVRVVSATMAALTAPPLAGSVRLTLRLDTNVSFVADQAWFSGAVNAIDDGAGLIVIPAGQFINVHPYLGAVPRSGARTLGGQVIGAINYATGVITLTPQIAISFTGYRHVFSATPGWVPFEVNVNRNVGFTTTVVYRIANLSALVGQTDAFSFTQAPLSLDMTRTVGDPVVPGSVVFRLGGKTYIDRNGTLYTDVNSNTGAGTVAGTVNYGTGDFTLSDWANGAGLGFVLDACLTAFGPFTATDAFFRTAGSPVRPASFYVQATDIDGVLQTATSDQNGVITGAYTRGEINQTMGVVSVEWGEMVTAAGNEAEPWYDAGNVVGGQIWRPLSIIPSTLRYNCVVLSNLPLNADILGLDPVRLPSDGRVPIYRPADVVVIHNTQTITLPNPIVASTNYDAGRVGLAELWLVDQANVKVPLANYTVNLLTGILTTAGSLSLSGLVQPLRMKHRQEELNLLSDVQINGQLTLTQPLARSYDINSYVSGALLFGDMNARVTGVFDQATWTNAWSDAVIGSQATGQYNDVDYPIEVLNNGAVRERWRINFTSTTAFQVIGENLGVIGTGTTAADFSLVNALTGYVYFVLRAAGWGGGWGVGNQLRFNTIGATAPIWIARTILPGATLLGDSFDMQLRGDVD